MDRQDGARPWRRSCDEQVRRECRDTARAWAGRREGATGPPVASAALVPPPMPAETRQTGTGSRGYRMTSAALGLFRASPKDMPFGPARTPAEAFTADGLPKRAEAAEDTDAPGRRTPAAEDLAHSAVEDESLHARATFRQVERTHVSFGPDLTCEVASGHHKSGLPTRSPLTVRRMS